MAKRKNFPNRVRMRREGALARRIEAFTTMHRGRFNDTLAGELQYQRYISLCRREIDALEARLSVPHLRKEAA